MSNVYVDCETSGLKPGQIGQITMIVEETNGSLMPYNKFFAINSIDEGASKVTGRTVEDYDRLSDGNLFSNEALTIFSTLNGNTVIGHNVSFDIGFINAELNRLGIGNIECTIFDTMKYMKGTYKTADGKYKAPKLIELREYFNVNDDEIQKFCHELFKELENDVYAHDSIYDTTLTFVITKIMTEYKNSSIGYYVSRFVNH